MSDNNPHHPGVRSLLAKFEGQSPIASPPSRGRSPAASDSSGTARQLSKVRASFVTVDGVIQSNPASPLRKTSGRSDSPGIFGPKINSAEAESGRQAMVSPTPASNLEHTQNATLAQIMAENPPTSTKSTTEAKAGSSQLPRDDPATRTETAPNTRDTPPTKPEAVPAESKSASSDNLSQKSDSSGTVKKKPSSVGSARNVPSKSNVTAAPSASKSAPNNTNSKPSAREVAKERANSLAHKPSRVSLNPKTTSRTTRGSTPAQEAPKPTAASASARSGIMSPTRPTRVPGSMTAPSQASAGKVGGTGAPSVRAATGTATLHRKPSTLKSATGVQREGTPAASVCKQASRPSLPAQSANDAQPKQVNEGFLARMMRPTASSASKTQAQEKADAKTATKTTAASKAPRTSIGKAVDRGTSQAKRKNTTALRPHGEKSQASNKEPVSLRDGPTPQKEQESEKENIVQLTPASPKEAAPEKPAEVAAVEQPEAITKLVEEPAAPSQVEVSTPELANGSTEKSVEKPEPISEETTAEPAVNSTAVEEAQEALVEAETSTEAQIEAISDHVDEEKVAEIAAPSQQSESSLVQPKEAIEEPVATLESTAVDQVEASRKQEIVAPEPDVFQPVQLTDDSSRTSENKDSVVAEDKTISESSTEPTTDNTVEVEATEEKPAEVKSEEPTTAVQPATEAESTNIAVDIANLALH